MLVNCPMLTVGISFERLAILINYDSHDSRLDQAGSRAMLNPLIDFVLKPTTRLLILIEDWNTGSSRVSRHKVTSSIPPSL